METYFIVPDHVVPMLMNEYRMLRNEECSRRAARWHIHRMISMIRDDRPPNWLAAPWDDGDFEWLLNELADEQVVEPLPLPDIRDQHGRLPGIAWPGGYPIIYITKDGSTVCSECANKDVDQSQEVVGYSIFHEGAPESCDDCGTLVESAYGDPDAEDAS